MLYFDTTVSIIMKLLVGMKVLLTDLNDLIDTNSSISEIFKNNCRLRTLQGKITIHFMDFFYSKLDV